ncbi:MAG TPA: type 1 glutamine amidotransferase domain-containing protein [Polyangiaceae bacterium]|nr:type 1 glutamine amidotransferase domain-containing protein [Polyangiaceae bacterium]
MPKRALIVVTNHDRLGDTGKPTGAYLAEIAHPHEVLRKAGVLVDFASPKGGRVPLDGVDRKDPINAAFLDDAALVARLNNSLRADRVEPGNYDAIFYAGGHGTMWDFPDEPALARAAAAIYERGGVVAAVCHGPVGLVNIKLSSGDWLVAGKDVAAFTNEEERAVGLAEVVPFLLADRLVERGARHHPAPKFQANVVVSERLVTGQNPASARGVAEKVAELLAR